MLREGLEFVVKMAATNDFIVPLDTPIHLLECKEAFDTLSNQERTYAHYLSRAAWEGSLIVLLQTSPESAPFCLLIQQLFQHDSMDQLKEIALKQGLTEEQWQALVMYMAAFFSNMGNFKGFGDVKFVPGISKEQFWCLVKSSSSYMNNQSLIAELWDTCSNALYRVDEGFKHLGFPQEGITTYYSANCNREDAELIQRFMTSLDLMPYNTRLFKHGTSGSVSYELRLASVARNGEPYGDNDEAAPVIGEHVFEGVAIKITRGDYSSILARVVENLRKAKDCATNENEAAMLMHYIRSFETGSAGAHKEGSRFWIKNKGPIIETYIGFIETYRDPYGVRGEFEGFVAMVNKHMSAKFSDLVKKAESFLQLLPWPKSFEKDTFLRPDFTSLDVLSFAGSGIPAGINIPNYDEVRQNEGFKNVSLGNVLSASFQDQNIPFLTAEDAEMYKKLKGPSFEVQVGLHELLGHGSGKHMQQDKNGLLNFDIEKVLNPITGEKISSWYKDGESYDCVFKSMGSSYEECRAECVGLYLCLSGDVLNIFGYDGTEGSDVAYINWLSMVRAGFLGLEFYNPVTKNWGQAHMRARYVIMQVLREVGMVTISNVEGTDGQSDLVIKLDRSKIETEGKSAIGNFLCKLNVYKALADYPSASKLYNHYSTVSEEFLEMRKIVKARKQPRRMFVQYHTELKGDKVELVSFDSSASGLVQSNLARFPHYCQHLEQLWRENQSFWHS